MSAPDETPEPTDGAAAIEQKIAEYAKLGLPAAAVLGAALAGALQGPGAAILVLAGGALVAVIAIFWASVRTLVGETPLTGADAYAIGAPRAEEEQKRAVLRALKDLDFERSVGKISEEDYQALVARYRAEAKRLLRALDEEALPRREQVEAIVAKRLRREGLTDADGGAYRQRGELGAQDALDEEPEGSAPKAKTSKAARKRKQAEARASKEGVAKIGSDEVEPTETLISRQGLPTTKRAEATSADALTCLVCGTVNDVDAVFCKKCGERRQPAGGAS